MEPLNFNVFLMSLEPEVGTQSIITFLENLRSKLEGYNDNITVTTLTVEGGLVRKAIEIVFATWVYHGRLLHARRSRLSPQKNNANS